MISKYISNICQRLLPLIFHFLCLVMASLFKCLSKVARLFLKMRSIQAIEHWYNQLAQISLALHNFQQLIEGTSLKK